MMQYLKKNKIKTVIIAILAIVVIIPTLARAADDLRITVTNDTNVILDFNLFWVNHPFDFDQPAPICGAELDPGESFTFNREGTWKFSHTNRWFALQWTYSYMNTTNQENNEYEQVTPVFVKCEAISVHMFFNKDYAVVLGEEI